jgi:hypothetical protein
MYVISITTLKSKSTFNLAVLWPHFFRLYGFWAGKFLALPYFPLSFGLLAMTQRTAAHSKQCLMAG